MPCPVGNDGGPVVAKTGMGSSDALVTSLVAALLQFAGVIDLEILGKDTRIDPMGHTLPGPLRGDAARSLVHNTAQAAHNLA